MANPETLENGTIIERIPRTLRETLEIIAAGNTDPDRMVAIAQQALDDNDPHDASCNGLDPCDMDHTTAETNVENRIVIEMDGGIVHAVYFNKAANNTRYLVVDYDTDGLAPHEVRKLANGERVYRSSPRDDTLSFDVLDRVAAGLFNR